jgi:phytoene dehydrogenase-like protein
VYEAAATVGGGACTEELTLRGFRHDPCSAVHPLGAGSPVLTRLPLARHGLRWVHPPVPLAHPFPDGSAAVLDRSVRLTMASLGQDAHAYRLLVGPFRGRWDELAADVLRPQLNGRPAHPVRLAKFGLRSALPTAATSAAAASPACRRRSGRCRGGSPYATPRIPRSTSAQRPRRRGRGCTAPAAITPR